jgi:DNA invertase Pin-like site-specific DNA recombinase
MESTLTNRFVAYRRVSTRQQGASGLGLEAQDQMINEYVARVNGAILGSFVEVESGKRNDRPELRKALALAKKAKATLLVAKLDRLARSVSFVSVLLDTPGVEFRAADFPDASRMMIQLLSVFAEYEREMISRRTKQALAARRARGHTLGTPANLCTGASPAPALNKAMAQAEAERMRPIIKSLADEGITTVRGVCATLNDRGYVTRRGMAWHPTAVARLLRRLAPTPVPIAARTPLDPAPALASSNPIHARG